MPLASSDRALTDVHDLAMLDLDGVVYIGGDAVPGAREALAGVVTAGMGVAYLTNNANRPAATVAAHLRELGMPVPSDADVVTASQAVARLVAEALPEGSRVLVVGGEGLRTELAARGLECATRLDDDVAAVVQGFNPELGWADLAEASYAVNAGLPWFASNTDLTFPSARGTAPGNGSLVQAVANATRTRPVVAGKPERALFDETLDRLGPSRPLMVGDRIDTDIEGAARLDIASLAVLTGVSTVQDLAEAPEDSRPSFVGDDLGALLVAHPPVEVEDADARCGDAHVRAVDGRLEVVRDGEGLHLLRAVVGLAWHVTDDTGAAVRLPDLPAVR